MEIQDAITVIKNLKEYYDNYSLAFDVAIQQLEGTLATRLAELDDVKQQLATANSLISNLQATQTNQANQANNVIQ